MTHATHLDLPYLAMDEQDFSSVAFEAFAEARNHHAWLARCPYGYAVTSYTAVRELMAMEHLMRMPAADMANLMGARGTPWGEFLVNTVQGQDGAHHTRLRRALARSFTPREANRHRSLMREVITLLLDEWTPLGRFDFEEFAAHFPITVMCRIVGASPAAIPELRTSLEALGLGGSMNPAILPRLQEAFGVIDSFSRDLVAQRRSSPPREGCESDLLDTLLEAVATQDISEAELLNLLVFLFVAGYDTSKNVLTLMMRFLLDRPEDYARCAADIGFCRRFLNETMRFHGVASLPRVVTSELTLRGVAFPAETMIFLPWSVLGRDPAMVDHPDRFDPDRSGGSPHVGFGLGPHICLGQFIARAQIEEGIHLIAGRLGNPRLDGPTGWRPFPGAWGLKGLPIAFDPVP